jgi:hypothetical protein
MGCHEVWLTTIKPNLGTFGCRLDPCMFPFGPLYIGRFVCQYYLQICQNIRMLVSLKPLPLFIACHPAFG